MDGHQIHPVRPASLVPENHIRKSHPQPLQRHPLATRAVLTKRMVCGPVYSNP